MSKDLLAQYGAEAKAAADEVRAELETRVPSDIFIEVIPGDEENGSNRLDRSFLDALLRGDHLNEGYLSGI